jgi:hypothetical protein
MRSIGAVSRSAGLLDRLGVCPEMVLSGQIIKPGRPHSPTGGSQMTVSWWPAREDRLLGGESAVGAGNGGAGGAPKGLRGGLATL